MRARRVRIRQRWAVYLFFREISVLCVLLLIVNKLRITLSVFYAFLSVLCVFYPFYPFWMRSEEKRGDVAT